MTSSPLAPLSPLRSHTRKRLVVLRTDRDEARIDWHRAADDAGRAWRSGGLDVHGCADWPSCACALCAWDGSGPDAA